MNWATEQATKAEEHVVDFGLDMQVQASLRMVLPLSSPFVDIPGEHITTSDKRRRFQRVHCRGHCENSCEF